MVNFFQEYKLQGPPPEKPKQPSLEEQARNMVSGELGSSYAGSVVLSRNKSGQLIETSHRSQRLVDNVEDVLKKVEDEKEKDEAVKHLF